MHCIRLYYWPTLPGRGEFVRLILEASQTQYTDVARLPTVEGGGIKSVIDARQGALGEAAGFAPPYLVDGELVLSQTPAICAYLAERTGLVASSPAAKAKAQQLFLTVMDLTNEVHDTHHPLGSSIAYEAQVDASREAARLFCRDRLPDWLAHFAGVLSQSGGRFLLGVEASYADLALAHALEGVEYAFPTSYAQVAHNHRMLRELRDAVWVIPSLAAYRASKRRIAFNQEGLFRFYPELQQS